jgi:hypothetical protein
LGRALERRGSSFGHGHRHPYALAEPVEDRHQPIDGEAAELRLSDT